MLKVALVGFGGIAQIHRYVCWVDILLGKIENTKNPSEGSAKTIALLHKLLESAFENKKILLED